MRKLGRIDPGAYLQAFALLARNPVVMLAPLVVEVAFVLVGKLLPPDTGGGILGSINSGITSLIRQLLVSFGLAVSLIVADTAWRRGRAPFDDALDQARRRAGDIFMAALGFGFVLYVATVAGGFVPFGAVVLYVVATFFFLYALPAAAIGGIPGGAALQISLERARSAPLPTAAVTVLYLYLTLFFPAEIAGLVYPPIFLSAIPDPGDVVALVVALVSAVAFGYLALVLAKTYNDLSYGRRY